MEDPKMGKVEMDDPKRGVEMNFGIFGVVGVYYHVSQNLSGHMKWGDHFFKLAGYMRKYLMTPILF